MLDPATLEHRRKFLRVFNRDRTDENRLTCFVTTDNLLDHRTEFIIRIVINLVVRIFADNGTVRRNLDDIHIVDLSKLVFLRLRRTGHAGKFREHAEIVLECNRCKGLRLALNRYMLFGFDCLMQSVAIAATLHNAPRKLVDDEHLVILDDIVDVAVHRIMRLECLIDMVCKFHVLRIREVLNAEIALRFLRALLREACRAFFSSTM